MSTEISFDVEVSRIGTTYGLVLSLHEEETNDDEDPCYFLVFEGPVGHDPVDAAKLFVTAHQDAMKSVGLGGEMTEEDFAEKLEASIEVAGDLMVRHGFTAQDVEQMDEGILAALFAEEPEEEQDIRKLN